MGSFPETYNDQRSQSHHLYLPLLGHALDTIVAKANKLLGPLKWVCPLITDVNVRRTLYLFLVKSQVKHATQVWSPNQYSLKAKIGRVQKRATRIVEMS